MGKQRTDEEFRQEMAVKQPNINIFGRYVKYNVGVHCGCSICGFDHYDDGRPWTPTPNFLLSGGGCPVCSMTRAAKTRMKTTEIFIKEMAIKQPYIKVLGAYNGNHIGIHCQCLICGFDRYNNGALWMPQPNNLLHGEGCPNCSSELKTSFAEQAILFYCSQLTHAENRYIGFGKELDIWLPSVNIGIEHNGSYFHSNKINNDEDKQVFFVQNGIRFIVVRDGCENSVNGNVITYKNKYGCNKDLDWAIKTLIEILNIGSLKYGVDTSRDSLQIYGLYMKNRKENSFAIKYPEKAREWDYDKNIGVTPDMVSAKSKKKFYRICPDCHKSYLISIYDWSHLNTCWDCSYKRRSGKNHPHVKPIYLYRDGVMILDEALYVIKNVSKFLQVSVDMVSDRLKSGKPLTKGPYAGCTISYIVPNEYNTK